MRAATRRTGREAAQEEIPPAASAPLVPPRLKKSLDGWDGRGGEGRGGEGMDGWMDRWIDGCRDGWMDGWMDAGTDGWMDGWMDN